MLNANRVLRCLNLFVGFNTNQATLDGLPAVCPYIEQLNIKLPDELASEWITFYTGDWSQAWLKNKVNYEFLLDFKFLANVSLSEIASQKQIINLFKRNSHVLHLQMADNAVSVTRNAWLEYKLIYRGRLVFSSKNVDELVHFIDSDDM